MARILVVDDDPDILKLVEKVLRLSNHEVLTTVDAIKAMDVLNSTLYDLLITDANMPHFSGFELTRTIKNNKRFDKMAICMMTGLREKKDIEKAMRAGVDDYIVKPIDPTLLMGKVESLFIKHPPMERATYHFYEGSTSADASMTFKTKVTQLSELGLTIRTPFEVMAGLEIQVNCDVFKRMQMNLAPRMKVVSCRRIHEFDYEAEIVFVGVSDIFYQKVRAWIGLQGQGGYNKEKGKNARKGAA